MTTLHEALVVAEQELKQKNIVSYYVDRRRDRRRNEPVVWAESPDGGFYLWYSPAIDDPTYPNL